MIENVKFVTHESMALMLGATCDLLDYLTDNNIKPDSRLNDRIIVDFWNQLTNTQPKIDINDFQTIKDAANIVIDTLN